ncbi:Oxysterol-binding protein-related protein 6 [Liparis tanakae]|uniref:Oxysterol-binding protein-related protein 6 n=1 Tax=Liparis tanakae TaxID=230148 RepID=A0A4Z2F6H8_9TELE|nr:Oxysterol-binding protein-related protein 6 [Liparis tanakae]
MSIKKRARRIDLDTEEHIYHLKVKSQDIFDAWVSKLRHHRLYRQNEIVRSPREATMRTFPPPAAQESPKPASSVAREAQVSPLEGILRLGTSQMVENRLPDAHLSSRHMKPYINVLKSASQVGPCLDTNNRLALCQYQYNQAKPSSLPWQPAAPSSISTSSLPASYSNGQSKVVAWLQESEEMDKCSEELARCQSNLTDLSRLLQSLEILQRTQSAPNFTEMQVPLSASMSPVRLHSSNPNLCAELVDFQPPVSRLTDSVECASDYIKLQEEFCTIAQKVHSLLKSAFNTVAIEKEKIKQILSDQEQSDQSAQINSLRKSLSQCCCRLEVKKVFDAHHRERWVSNNTYWELRKNPGFINIESTMNLW